MAHIKIERPSGTPGWLPTVAINGVDMTNEIYAGSIQLVSHGDPSGASEVALQLRIAVSRLDINEHEDIDLTALFGGFVYMAKPLAGDE